MGTFALLLALGYRRALQPGPGFAALRTNLLDSLKEGLPTGTGTKSHSWLRSALVVSEIATALVLLIVSAAFLRSYQKMLSVDPGFQSQHVLVASYQLPSKQYPTNSSIDKFNHACHRSPFERAWNRRLGYHHCPTSVWRFRSIGIHPRGCARLEMEIAVRQFRNHLRRLLSRDGYSSYRRAGTSPWTTARILLSSLS